jgi:phage terminase large subunit-like protein
MPPTSIAQPLRIEEQQKLVSLLSELKSRGLEMPEDYKNLLSPEIKKDVKWRLGGNGYFLKTDGKQYVPTEQQKAFISSEARFVLLRSGRGGGKSAAGSQKAMFRVMRGEDGAVINPVFSDFKTSTWPEFKQWIDWNMVVPSQKHRRNDAWSPHQPFTMVFTNGAKVYCKGLKDPKSARGANINWLWYDEAASDQTGMSWKIAIASVRVGKNPQAWATTTPKGTEHWVYKFFVEKEIPQEAVEILEKDDRILIETFKGTINDNKANLDPGFYASIVSAFPSGWLRAQEVDGDFATEGGKIGDRRWFDGKIRDAPPEIVNKRVRFWDLAATEKKQVKDDPDEMVGTLLSKRYEPEIKKDIFCIEHQVAGQWAWEQILEAIANTARHDGVDIPVVLEEEPGSGGKNQIAAVKTYFKTFPELAYHKVVGQSAKKVGDRVMAANHWFGVAAEGRFEMVKGMWNEKTLAQIDGFCQIIHDDRVTSITGAFTYSNPFRSWVKVPFFSIGSKNK